MLGACARACWKSCWIWRSDSENHLERMEEGEAAKKETCVAAGAGAGAGAADNDDVNAVVEDDDDADEDDVDVGAADDGDKRVKCFCNSAAVACASMVLPVPGGPYSRIDMHACRILDCWKTCGKRNGSSTASFRVSFACAAPHTSFQPISAAMVTRIDADDTDAAAADDDAADDKSLFGTGEYCAFDDDEDEDDDEEDDGGGGVDGTGVVAVGSVVDC
jgi:hypothetical protein